MTTATTMLGDPMIPNSKSYHIIITWNASDLIIISITSPCGVFPPPPTNSMVTPPPPPALLLVQGVNWEDQEEDYVSRSMTFRKKVKLLSCTIIIVCFEFESKYVGTP